MKNFTKKISVLALAMNLGLAAGVASANVNDTTALDANGYALSPYYGAGTSFTDMFSFTAGSVADYNNYLIAAVAGSPVSVGLTFDTSLISISNFSLYKGAALIPASAAGSLPGALDLTSGSLAAGTYTVDITGKTVSNMAGTAGYVLAVSPIPEPGEWAMMVSGLGLFGFIATRRSGLKFKV